jgi:5'-deoxynucleotidase YfbR-like HD superfamily hydrolase
VTERYGDWIITYTNGQFWPLDPRPEEIHIEDIAHALALMNRFAGHSKFPYSVAQHSIACSYVVPKEHALGALLHDASEAYICDIPKPAKRFMPEYVQIEENIMEAVEAKFDVDTYTVEIKQADIGMLVTEAATLFPDATWYKDTKYWHGSAPLQYDYVIEELYWWQSEEMFLERFHELTCK